MRWGKTHSGHILYIAEDVQKIFDFITKTEVLLTPQCHHQCVTEATYHLTECGFIVWLLHSPLFCKASSFWDWRLNLQASKQHVVCVFYPLCFFLFVCVSASSITVSHWQQAMFTTLKYRVGNSVERISQLINYSTDRKLTDNNFSIWLIF